MNNSISQQDIISTKKARDIALQDIATNTGKEVTPLQNNDILYDTIKLINGLDISTTMITGTYNYVS